MTNATSRRNLSLGLYFQHDQAITLSTSAGAKWHVPDEATLANASGAPLGTFQKPKGSSVPSSSNRADDAWKDFILKSYFALYNVSTTFDFEFAYPDDTYIGELVRKMHKSRDQDDVDCVKNMELHPGNYDRGFRLVMHDCAGTVVAAALLGTTSLPLPTIVSERKAAALAAATRDQPLRA